MIVPVSKRDLVAQTLLHSGCGRLLRLARSWRGLLVLNYHRIGDGSQSPFDRNLWSATAEDFDRQVRFVAKEFDLIGLDDLADVFGRKGGRYVLITFDDGYLDNYTEAFPVLKAHNAPAVFFLTTGYIDVPQIPWWDEIAWMVRSTKASQLQPNDWVNHRISLRTHAERDAALQVLLKTYKKIPGKAVLGYMQDLAELLDMPRCPQEVVRELWMTWPMIREMRDAGMSFGGHTVNHPILANLSPDEQEFEVAECQRRLTAELGAPAKAFSYPVGGRESFNEHTRAALQRHGFQWGFTYIGGNVPLPCRDPYAIPRAAIETDVNHPLFRAIMTLPQWFS